MSQGYWTPFHRLGPIDFVTLLYNVSICTDVDCDPDYTRKELIKAIEKHNGAFTKDSLERVLFLLNMNDEANKFWHPYDKSFDKFLVAALPRGYFFDKEYNLIKRKRVKL